MKLASNLLKLCKARGLSLAKVAREAGVPVQTLHGWQTAKGGSHGHFANSIDNPYQTNLKENVAHWIDECSPLSAVCFERDLLSTERDNCWLRGIKPKLYTDVADGYADEI